MRTINPSKVLWHRQRVQAFARKIIWDFSYEDWLAWWVENLGPRWQEKRGPKMWQFCMARNNDVGPYARWNVKCITNIENIRSGTGMLAIPYVGETFPRSKLTNAQARAIFTGDGCIRKMSIEFDVSYDTVGNIRAGRGWVAVTTGLTRGKDCECYQHGHKARKCKQGLSFRELKRINS